MSMSVIAGIFARSAQRKMDSFIEVPVQFVWTVECLQKFMATEGNGIQNRLSLARLLCSSDRTFVLQNLSYL